MHHQHSSNNQNHINGGTATWQMHIQIDYKQLPDNDTNKHGCYVLHTMDITKTTNSYASYIQSMIWKTQDMTYICQINANFELIRSMFSVYNTNQSYPCFMNCSDETKCMDTKTILSKTNHMVFVFTGNTHKTDRTNNIMRFSNDNWEK